MTALTTIDGGVTAPQGFRAGGVHCGIKKRKPDLALLVSDVPATTVGVLTTNRIQGATVKLCRERLQSGRGQAIVVNSGNANACTGPQGLKDAYRMGTHAAHGLKIDESLVYVCSTGPIGVSMPMATVEAGIEAVIGDLAADGATRAAQAIMTTDKTVKACAREVAIGGRRIRVGGMAKGAGMIEPKMATMLAFITTDAVIDRTDLQTCLNGAVNKSFNRITVDGDQSCNDTVLFMANGAAGGDALKPGTEIWDAFCEAVNAVTFELAAAMVMDGEGATKFVTIVVRGATTDAEAERAARAVGNSLLVKTSWFGEDPNWGRVIDAVGYSGAAVDEATVRIAFDGVTAFADGVPSLGDNRSALEAVMKQAAFTLAIDLKLGSGSCTLYACDCSHEYVRINSEYMT